MKNTIDFVKKKKKYFFAGGVVLVILLYMIFGRTKAGVDLFVVERVNIEQSVMLAGKIRTTDRADLGFASSGRMGRVFIKNNQPAKEGQVLAQLEIGDLLADLKIKQANLQTSDIDLSAAKDELDKVTTQEDTKVKNAYRNLLSEGLELTPNANDYNVDAPTIGGIYDGVDGRYKITIEKKKVTFTDVWVKTFGLERTENVLEENAPTALGTKGLYVSFDNGDLSAYENTTWFLDIPNKANSFYLANFNAYNESKNTRDRAIQEAESAYDKLLAEEGDGSSVAQAEIQKINAEIRKNTIYAPFNGTVTNIEKEVGENASVGERVISILGDGGLEVVLQVSELDVAKMVPGLDITISVDAIPGEVFSGVLRTVNSKETEIDGVPVYEAFVELAPQERIKTGMSASGNIVIASKSDVLAIPNYLVKKVGDTNMVSVLTEDGKTTEREVTLGLLGTDSMVEVISGLSAGEKIVSDGAGQK